MNSQKINRRYYFTPSIVLYVICNSLIVPFIFWKSSSSENVSIVTYGSTTEASTVPDKTVLGEQASVNLEGASQARYV